MCGDNEPRSVELVYFFLLASVASSVTNDIKDIYIYMSRSSIQLIASGICGPISVHAH